MNELITPLVPFSTRILQQNYFVMPMPTTKPRTKYDDGVSVSERQIKVDKFEA